MEHTFQCVLTLLCQHRLVYDSGTAVHVTGILDLLVTLLADTHLLICGLVVPDIIRANFCKRIVTPMHDLVPYLSSVDAHDEANGPLADFMA